MPQPDKHSESRARYLPPWTSPYIIGIAGTSGSGKTSVAAQIIKAINQPWTVLLSMDNFYRPLNQEQLAAAFRNEHDLDAPQAIDHDLLYETLVKLRSGRRAEIPIYSFSAHARTGRKFTIYGADVIIVEGIYALYDPRLYSMMDLKLYVDTDLDVCLARRLSRDIAERGRDLAGVMQQWERFVKPNADAHVRPTMAHADLIVPRGADNDVAIGLIVRHVAQQLARRSADHVRQLVTLGRVASGGELRRNPNVHFLPDRPQIGALVTQLFDCSTPRDAFVFTFDRVALLLINAALELLSFEPYTVETPVTGGKYTGLRQIEQLCAVNMLRAGDCFTASLKKTYPGIPVGKMLIQADVRTGEPRLHTEKLPPIVTEGAAGRGGRPVKVLLFDAQVASGAAAIMAVQVLRDHGIAESEIVFVSFLVSEEGIGRLLAVFPDIHVVVAHMSADRKMYGTRFVDERYYGT